ncbi:small G protein signaling modulator 1-like protein [Anopheles sinensis]|uniref:Small G protein signaling modulator 1-like protein n=1 Tax=Anopheles sinensis TaxID=74873 RepID=A0A084W8H5_ANOSI|nr:small G protein signaling modulator 1-like protein [Anopheles sinensis]
MTIGSNQAEVRPRATVPFLYQHRDRGVSIEEENGDDTRVMGSYQQGMTLNAMWKRALEVICVEACK